ncbi:MAG: hypothetical protein Q4C49_06040 [Bacillota bacterium]|nr:hypothetical protein [Bacillota bacterium]
MAEKKETTKKKSSTTKKEESKKKPVKKEPAKKKKTSKSEDLLDDVLVSVGKEVAEKIGIDKKLVTKKNVKMVTSLVKENEKVKSALNTLDDLLGNK